MYRRIAPLCAVLLFAACGGGEQAPAAPTPPPAASVASVQVSGAPAGALDVSATVTLQATARDAAGATIAGRAVTWRSSNDAIATVSASGVVATVATGTATISATIDNVTGSVEVRVLAVPRTITLSPATGALAGSLDVGVTLVFQATARDATGATLSGREVTWQSSNAAVATVNANGAVTTLTSGTATILATVDNVTGSLEIRVVAVPRTLTLAPTTGTLAGTIDVGATVTLQATPRDVNGATITGRTVTWRSSNDAIATVTASGVVSTVSTGTATISATVDAVTGSLEVRVLAVPRALTLSPSTGALLVGDTLHLVARVLDALNRPMSTLPTFTALDARASVSSLGVVTALAPGATVIRATLGSLQTQASLTVAPGGGTRVAALAAVDSVVIAELARLGIPGASVAISRNGALVFARGYGYADSATKRPMATNTQLRVGSTSKPLTAVATMKLVQDGVLSLDDKPFVMLSNLPPLAGKTDDPRLAQVTVRDLLQHSAGWNVSRAVDDTVWAAVWRDQVMDQQVIARYGRGVPLSTAPGTTHAYNNYGYQVLGRLIERVSGQSYETFVRNTILTPAGVVDMRLGRTPLAQRTPFESTCYDRLAPTTSLFGTGKWCDVAPSQEYAEASGSWIASATEMLRWMSIIDGMPGARTDLFTTATINAMMARSSTIWPGNGYYYALGWEASVEAGGLRWYHSGAQTGGDGWITRLPNGVSIAILANLTRGAANGGGTLDPAVLAIVRTISNWPAGVQF